MKFPRLLAIPLALVLFAGAPRIILAQSDGGSSAVTGSLNGLHNITATNIMKTAEMLDEELYSYRPSEDVRTAGEILAHVANAQFLFCSVAAGTDNPSRINYEEAAMTKDEIIAALTAGFEYCGEVYGGMTDEEGAVIRDLFGMQMAGSAIMAFNSAHNYEHYGNLVTYMRIKGIVPPSSM